MLHSENHIACEFMSNADYPVRVNSVDKKVRLLQAGHILKYEERIFLELAF